MKLVVTAFLLASLAISVPAQSTTPPPARAHEAGSKQDKKDQKAKTKSQKKETSKTANADAGKKTSSTQDAAYAAAYKAGIPK